MIINGKVRSNYGVAGRNIKLQVPYFGELPHKDDLYDGTINLDIYPQKFKVIKAHYRTNPINWGEFTEYYEFIKVLKIRLGHSEKSEKVIGYLYLPSGSPNRKGGEVLEIWTEKKENIYDGLEIEIEIPDGYLSIS